MTALARVLVPGLCAAVSHRPDDHLPSILGRLLGRGRAEACSVGGWEAEAARCLGFRQVNAGSRTCLAWPVTLIPGLADLTASPVGDLDEHHREMLWAAVQSEIERIGARRGFRVPVPDEIEVPGEGIWQGLPPSAGLGRPMAAIRMDTPVARTLQAFATFVQMTWFDHPVNRERVEAGSAPVHGLWLWSPGTPVAEPEVRRVAGGGATGRWLAELASIPWCADPLDPSADLTVIETFLDFSGGNGGLDDQLVSLAEDVLEPRIEGLRRGASEGIVLQDPGSFRLELDGRDWRCFWRRRRGFSGLCRTSGD